MKRILFVGLMGSLLLCLDGCYSYVAFNPEKTKAQFYEDQDECEKKARDYVMERRWNYSVSDEISYSRRCMRDKGWKYHFRK
ncbi:MAG: hypothetical protein GY710_10825 [Desulfobacteraceae bacterium]|nr:hypothetical protein [Desulfobacteraceae bacterium]